MNCSGSCRQFCLWLGSIPCHRGYDLGKEIMPALPPCFSTTFLGEMPPGAVRQLRGPFCAHVHEYPTKFVIHKDYVSADDDPVGHLLHDAPEYLGSLAAVLLTSFALAGRRNGPGTGRKALIGGLAGAFALLAGKTVKMLQ